jgi:hypothetical protein
MSAKATEKMIEALTLFMEGYQELQESVEADFTSESKDDDDDTVSAEMDAAIVAEVRVALESVMDSEDYSSEEFAAAISSLTESLEELDPDVFSGEEDEDEDEEEDDDEDDEDEDFDYDEDDDLELDDDDYDDDEDDD